MRLSVIAPAFNEEAVLPLFFDRLTKTLDTCGIDYEIICVNDGSRDQSLLVLLQEQRRNPRVKIIDLSRNFGKDVALCAGLEAASGDMVLPIDVDLQDPPELVEQFIALWETGYDVVYGVRVSRKGDTPVKRMTAGMFYRVFDALSDVRMPRDAGDFRLMDRAVVEVVKQLPERTRFMKGLFAWVGFRQIGVPYVRPERAAGRSAWPYWKLWNFALDGLTSFSTVPLRIWTYIGAASALASFSYGAFLILDKLFMGIKLPGYASLMVVVLFSFGIQMMAFGILGEYLGRIFAEVKARPLYVTRKLYGFEGPG
jgi:glycosyltransferase involved in cell wall biosynthesis